MHLRALLLALGVGTFACGGQPPARDATAAKPSSAASPAEPPLEIARSVPGRVRVLLEIHATSNLIYQLDCMVDLMPCSSEAYRLLWRKLGWESQDALQLTEWKRLRQRTRGELQTREDQATSFAVLTASRSSDLDKRQRWAGYEAHSIDDFVRLVTMVADVGDPERMGAILTHFEPRFSRWWRAEAAPVMVPFVEACAKLVASPAVSGVMDQAVRFYGTDLPQGMRFPIHFLYRPALGIKQTFGEMVEARASVETLAGEDPPKRMGVILHEIFHLFYARMPAAARARMIDAFAARPEPHAMAAYALYDEALATALGNGVVDALLEPEANAKTRSTPLALYSDAAIDQAARSLLQTEAGPGIEQLLPTARVGESSFVARYVQGASSVFAHGLRPIDTLRLFAAASSEQFRDARAALQSASATHEASTYTPIDAEVRTMMHDAPRQSVALFVQPTELGLLRELVPAATLKRLQRTAKARAAFVDATARGTGSYVYVFVAKDGAAAKTLVDGFAALPKTAEGVLPL